MPARFVLFLDGSRLDAFRWHEGLLEPEGQFGTDGAGVERFAAYLHKRRNGLFHLLADVSEEGFQLEDIPYVRGADRTALLTRKLGQYFYGSQLSVAISQGRLPEGRRDERILLTALTRPQHFEPWLVALRAAECRVAGVFSVPLVAESLATALAGGRRQFLLISFTRGGLRQTFFENGRLRFSRLTVLAVDTVEEMANSAALESAKIHQYLVAQRLVVRGTRLPTIVLAHPGQAASLRNRCRDTEDLAYEVADLAHEARRWRLRSLPADSHAELLFMHLLMRQVPKAQFAHGDERRFFKLWRLRSAILATGTVLFAGALLYSGKVLVEQMNLQSRVDALKAQIATDQQRYAGILGGLPKVPLGNDDLRLLVRKFDEVTRRSPAPDGLLAAVGSALLKDPRIELDRLAWSVTDNPEGEKSSTASPRTEAPHPSGTAAYAILDLAASLPSAMASDRRAQLTAVENLADLLRKDTALKVDVLSMPFEVESGKSLRSGSEGRAVAERPRFTLRIAVKL
ncbi:MAG TPA: hypothetical protein PKD29_00070 [Rhodocyclaceae bacterium]|nr:hypothetical protein [Rhodocyclaceae bacterium]